MTVPQAVIDRLRRDMDAIYTPDRILPRDAYYQYVGEAIRAHRHQIGWSQAQLGAKVGVTHVAVCRWEAGEDAPDAWTIDRLERLLGEGIRP